MIEIADDVGPRNPLAPEDGMIRCPRKAHSAIATGRCAQMRDADLCGKCRGMTLEAPVGTGVERSAYLPKFPYTEDCHHKGHKPSAKFHGCLTCGGIYAARSAWSAPACAHSKNGEHLAECPIGTAAWEVKEKGCPYQGARQRCIGRAVRICTYRPSDDGRATKVSDRE